MFFTDVVILILTAAILAAVYFFVFCYRGASWPKSIVKTLSVLLLALAGYLGRAEDLLILALCLSGLGDYLLSRDSEAQFMAGVVAFASAHIAYVALFLTTGGAGLHRLSQSDLIIVAGLTLFGLFMMRALYRNAGDLRVAVCIYVPVILSMGVAALMMPGGFLGVTFAAFLFMVSDSILASEMFLLRDGHPLRRITPFAVWSTYWLAQAGFLLAYPVNF